MQKITFISTVHKDVGKCNAEELYKIIEKLSPEVVFLEALDDTYSEYQKFCFSSFGVYHEKLEISAIQKYSFNNPFEYVPVLDNGLSDSFEKRYKIVSENIELQKLIDNFNKLAEIKGFEFLNSIESIRLQKNMRELENRILGNIEMKKAFTMEIDEYENSMIRNIYSYCKNNQFRSAIFMCGVAHRKSIIEKIDKYIAQEHLKLNWIVFEN